MTVEIIATKLPARNRSPGQNGFEGPSSLTPGQTAPRAAGNVAPPAASADAGDWQTRNTSTDQVAPTTFGHRDRNVGPAKVPSKTIRR